MEMGVVAMVGVVEGESGEAALLAWTSAKAEAGSGKVAAVVEATDRMATSYQSLGCRSPCWH